MWYCLVFANSFAITKLFSLVCCVCQKKNNWIRFEFCNTMWSQICHLNASNQRHTSASAEKWNLLSVNVRLVAVNPMLLLRRREAKAPHSRLWRAAVASWPADGVANAAIGQPASLAVVQPCKLPGRVKLAHFGDLCPGLLTGKLCLRQSHLVWGLQIEDFPWGKVLREFKIMMMIQNNTVALNKLFLFIGSFVVLSKWH